MKISVVIPAYNEEATIGTCLESLLNQEHPADEIIVVNNNSTDKTVSIVKQFPVRIVIERNQGMTPARNAGYNAAQHEIIARCDADSIVPPYWIQRIKENFETGKIDALSGPIRYRNFPAIYYTLRDGYRGFLKFANKGTVMLAGPNHALKKKMWNKIKNNVCSDDKQVHEDFNLSIEIRKVKGVIMYDRGLVVYTSARRIFENPHSFFLEYPLRTIRTFMKP